MKNEKKRGAMCWKTAVDRFMKLSRERQTPTKERIDGGTEVKQGSTCCCSVYMCDLKEW